MDPDVKRRWLEALRSGRYEQANGYLSINGGYCCLGVLCEVAVEDGVIYRYDDDDSVVYASTAHEADSSRKVLPERAVIWADIRSENPSFEVALSDIPSEHVPDFLHTRGLNVIERDGNHCYNVTLAELNDVYRLSFNQIADLVEKYL